MAIIVSVPTWGATLINDTETERLLYELVRPLADAADITPDRLSVHIINDSDFNAFVRGGEDVFVNTGLLTQIKNPDALQSVIAHELGHTIGGHMAQLSSRMDAEMKRTMLIQALGIGLMVAGGNPSLGAGVLAGAGGVATSSMMAFSRDEERIADNLGIDLMIKSNLNPNGFITVFEQMDEITGAMESRINPNRINHPLTRERLKNATEYIAKHAPNYTPKSTTARDARYELVRAKLIGYLDTFENVKIKYPSTDKSDPAIYARAIANMRGGNLAGAGVGTRTLISRHPDNPYFYELLGDIEYQFGHYDTSIDAYEKSLSLADDAPQIQTALALVLTERRRPDDLPRAIELCKRALLAEPAPLTYWTLARAYDENDGRADWAMAEYYQMMGKTKDAHRYAKLAQKKLKKTDPEYIKSSDILKK